MAADTLAPKKPRRRLAPPSDNVTLSVRLPRAMMEALQGICTSTGMTPSALGMLAVDELLHRRGAYKPYAGTPYGAPLVYEGAIPEAAWNSEPLVPGPRHPPPLPSAPPPLPPPPVFTVTTAGIDLSALPEAPDEE